MEQRNIVITGLQDFYSEIGSNAVNLANEFALEHKVLYVNYPLDRLTIWRHKKNPMVARRLDVRKGKQKAIHQVSENLWVFTPAVVLESISKIPNKTIFDKLLAINNKRYAKEVKKACAELGINDFILFEDSDLYRTVMFKELLRPDILLYYSRDNITATDYFKVHGERIEKLMMQKADAVVCNSAYLAHLAKRYNDNSFDVGQGVDTGFFSEKPVFVPEPLRNIDKPVVGYVGALNAMRLDVELIEQVARECTEWVLMLVGPEDDKFRDSKLHQMSNVVFTGGENYDKLPAYVHGFDVAINPQIVNSVTIGNYPRKIDEYLAAGKPVVAVETEAMKMFSEVVYLARDKKGFIDKLRQAMNEKDRGIGERKKFANAHSWANSAGKIYTVIENILKQRRHGNSR